MPIITQTSPRLYPLTVKGVVWEQENFARVTVRESGDEGQRISGGGWVRDELDYVPALPVTFDISLSHDPLSVPRAFAELVVCSRTTVHPRCRSIACKHSGIH